MSTRGAFALALSLTLLCSGRAHAEPAPPKLRITVVARESSVSTLHDRVASWFTDGTAVEVVITSELDRDQALSASSSDVNAWIIPLADERALVTFSTLTDEHERHLIRDVRLPHGLDDLGLERLASVIHSAFVALESGGESIARADAERALGEAGLAGAKAAPPAEFEKPRAPPEAPAKPAPSPPSLAPNAEKTSRNLVPEWLLGVGYGARARGAEGFGHGPEALVGVRAHVRRTAFTASSSGQLLWRSDFEASPFTASVQTTTLRLRLGVEPAFADTWHGAVELGGGVDIASIRAHASASDVETNASGTQLRPTASAALGVIYARGALDIAVYGELTLLLDDVHYSVGTVDGERRLLAPARVEPGITLACRFRSAL